MCRRGDTLTVEAQAALGELLADICRTLDPEYPELVVVGPVDFGPEEAS